MNQVTQDYTGIALMTDPPNGIAAVFRMTLGKPTCCAFASIDPCADEAATITELPELEIPLGADPATCFDLVEAEMHRAMKLMVN